MERSKLIDPSLRPFNPENPDWRREYYIAAAAMQDVIRCAAAHVEHISAHPDPECPAFVMGQALLTSKLMLADEVLSRVPETLKKQHADEIAAVIIAEMEADRSSERS